jgi:hypothetical protein
MERSRRTEKPKEGMIPHAFEILHSLIVARRAAGHLLAGLDFDGTLAPIVPRPEDAALPADTREVIRALALPLSGYSLSGYFWILMVTFVSQFLGHIMINIGLRYFHATTMSVLVQTSVVTASIMAFLLFGEQPTVLQIWGSVIIIIGVFLASTAQIVRKD